MQQHTNDFDTPLTIADGSSALDFHLQHNAGKWNSVAYIQEPPEAPKEDFLPDQEPAPVQIEHIRPAYFFSRQFRTRPYWRFFESPIENLWK